MIDKKPKKKKDYIAMEKDKEAFEKHKFNYVKNALRIATYKWPYFNMALTRQRKDRGLYECESCKSCFGPKEINKDHIVPVIDVQKGFTTWQDYIDRLFVNSEGIQILCLSCHTSKTGVENEIRRKYGQKEIKIKNKLTKKRSKSKIQK